MTKWARRSGMVDCPEKGEVASYEEALPYLREKGRRLNGLKAEKERALRAERLERRRRLGRPFEAETESGTELLPLRFE